MFRPRKCQPVGNYFEKSSGRLQGKSSICVNSQWRIVFLWDNKEGEADYKRQPKIDRAKPIREAFT